MMFSSRNGPKLISSILGELIASKGWGERLKEIQLPEFWKEVVGDSVAEKAKFIKFADGVIFITTVSSTWNSELRLRSENIIKQLNLKLGNESIKAIKFI